MVLAKFKFIRGHTRHEIPFDRPVFDVRAMMTAFFAMIFDALPKAGFAVNASELSIRQGSALTDHQVRYSIFGGATSVAMQADRLIFDFPGIQASDLQIIFKVMAAVHDAFPTAFPETTYRRVEGNSASHLALSDVETVDYVLSQFANKNVETRFGRNAVIARPAGKIDLLAADGSWAYSAWIERSALQPNAVFVYTTWNFQMSPATPFPEKLMHGEGIARAALATLGIEVDAEQ